MGGECLSVEQGSAHCPPMPRISSQPPPTSALSPLPACSKVRFDRPYMHPFKPPGAGEEAKLTIHQARFKEQGFASTGAAVRLGL